jgi:DMSO reductase anchor subunit
MTLFFTVLAGSVVGQLVSLFIVGALARRAEKKNQQELQRLLESYNASVMKERQRMVEYAKMES